MSLLIHKNLCCTTFRSIYFDSMTQPMQWQLFHGNNIVRARISEYILAHHSKNKMEQVSSILYQALFTSHELVLWWHTIVYPWVLIPFEGTLTLKRKQIHVLTETREMNSENSKALRYRASTSADTPKQLEKK